MESEDQHEDGAPGALHGEDRGQRLSGDLRLRIVWVILKCSPIVHLILIIALMFSHFVTSGQGARGAREVTTGTANTRLSPECCAAALPASL